MDFFEHLGVHKNSDQITKSCWCTWCLLYHVLGWMCPPGQVVGTNPQAAAQELIFSLHSTSPFYFFLISLSYSIFFPSPLPTPPSPPFCLSFLDLDFFSFCKTPLTCQGPYYQKVLFGCNKQVSNRIEFLWGKKKKKKLKTQPWHLETSCTHISPAVELWKGILFLEVKIMLDLHIGKVRKALIYFFALSWWLNSKKSQGEEALGLETRKICGLLILS